MGGMKLRGLLTEDRAVSPVIGIILMIAITVILGSLVGTFALGLWEEDKEDAPRVVFEFDYDESADELTVTHQTGTTFKGAAATFKELDGAGTSPSPSDWSGEPEVDSGDSVTISNIEPGATVLIVWNQQDQGEDTAVMGRWEGPDA